LQELQSTSVEKNFGIYGESDCFDKLSNHFRRMEKSKARMNNSKFLKCNGNDNKK